VTTATAPNLLEAIVAASRRAAEVRAASRSIDVVRDAVRRRPDGARFEAALRGSPAPRVVAECKRRSPSRGILRADYRPAEHARAYAAAGAAAISVLTEPTFFDGALEHLEEVRAAVDLPLLRKDFVVTEYQLIEAAAAGADAVLLIVGAMDDRELRAMVERATGLGLAALVEAHDVDEVQRAADAGARIIGVNSRDLRTLTVHPEAFAAAAETLPANVVAVAESGIRTRADIDRLGALGYHAFLVGERLIVEGDPAEALRQLRERLRPERGAQSPSESASEPSAGAGDGAPAQHEKSGPTRTEKRLRPERGAQSPSESASEPSAGSGDGAPAQHEKSGPTRTEKRLRPERGAQSPSESAWGWGPTRTDK
jgi:indole-3-glycerol phosphate synthase